LSHATFVCSPSQVDPGLYRGVITDDDNAALVGRNQARADRARAALGTRYLCHPANRLQRPTRPIPSLLLRRA
jgi:hypothetical protein